MSRIAKAHSQGSQSTPASPANSRLAPGSGLGKAATRAVQSANPSPRAKGSAAPFVFDKWEEDAVQTIFGVALDVSDPMGGRIVSNHALIRAISCVI